MLLLNSAPLSDMNNCITQLASGQKGEQGKGVTYNRIIFDTIGLAPGSHDPLVVAGNDYDLVHALGLELVEVGEVRGDVLLLAGGGEGAGDRDEDNFLVLELWMYGEVKLLTGGNLVV